MLSINCFFNRIFKKHKDTGSPAGGSYAYCPRCDARLTLQKGFQEDCPCWICRGCGEMLISPKVETEDNIAWICDKCGAFLNIQEGFGKNSGEWICTECGYINAIDEKNLYLSEDEFQADLQNPCRGLSDEDIRMLSEYRELTHIGDRQNICLVEHCGSGRRYVKKILTTYNRSIYEYLRDHPVKHMPSIYEIHESDNSLIIIEEYIEGKTVADFLKEKLLSAEQAVDIAVRVCEILDDLHHLPKAIIHRDIKPSNIMVSPEGEVWLLDMNVAKWYDPGKADDTRYLGTRFYAAPEQAGFGLSASSVKSDIYALGILLNVMVTGKFPKEKKAAGDLWNVIERCISMEMDERYDAVQLKTVLEKLRGGLYGEKINRRTE